MVVAVVRSSDMVDVVVLCDVVLCAFSDKCCCGPPLGCSFQEHSL